MNNSTDLSSISAELIAGASFGNSMLLITALIGFIMTTSQMVTTFFWKPLREMHQTLVINATIADSLKSVAYSLLAIKRLALAANKMDELIIQFDCMFWIWPGTFTAYYGLTSVLTLSLERLVVTAAPYWYKNNKERFLWVSAFLSCFVSLLGSFGLFIGASKDQTMLSCNILSSTTSGYYSFLFYFQDITTGCIILINLAALAMLIHLWKAAVKAKANMTQFKKDVQFNAMKAVFSVVILCLTSFFGGAIYLAAIKDLPQMQRALRGPYWGCLQLMRGMFDFSLWLVFNREYRRGFKGIFCKKYCPNQIHQTAMIQIGKTTEEAH